MRVFSECPPAYPAKCGNESGAKQMPSTVLFFSSRRRHTRFDCDWSSDVCSSDLQAAGKTGFELSWYYDNTKPITQQQAQVWTAAFQAAGFTPKPIGVSTAELRKKTRDYGAPVNMWQGPRGWCADWPSGNTWFPVLFQSHAIDDGQSWGFLSDKALDAEIDQVSALPVDQAVAKWSELDKKMMGMYLVLPRYYNLVGQVIGTNIGGARDDVTLGLALVSEPYLQNGSRQGCRSTRG